MRARWWVRALVLGVIAATAPLAAIERMRLPQFAITARDGRSVTTSAIARPGRWLVLYVPPGCEACASFLEHLAEGDAKVPARLVIIVGGASAAGVDSAAAFFPALSDVGWYGDPAGAAQAPLRLSTVPAIFGLNGDMIEWSLSGVLSPSAELRSVLANWIVQ